MDRLAATLLAPLLLAQGSWARRRALQMNPPEGATGGECGRGRPLRLLLVGDSACAGVGVTCREQAMVGLLLGNLSGDHRLYWRLHAESGKTSAQALTELAVRHPEPFDLAVSTLGVNDVTSSLSGRRWLGRQRQLVALLRERFGVRQVVLCGLPPMGLMWALPQPLRGVLAQKARRWDRALANWAVRQPHCHHLAFSAVGGRELLAEDGFHPGLLGHALWAKRLANCIRQLESQPRLRCHQ
ncbi:SGNH/GDSL hydrolase family protein [Gallaecimonas sp. GXIMD4217]|uniref:SGNH/GDSL hydrolase family protein n=1 Tax=Gallaecimonas sp. GXIMD4217 TaxID=3131927 RepID=UPI00311B2752